MDPIVNKVLDVAEKEIRNLKATIAGLDRAILERDEIIELLSLELDSMGYEKDKGKGELRRLKPILKASWAKRRWWHPVDLTHFAVDVLVESCRNAPYLAGHVLAWIILVDVVFLVSWLLTR